jgi:hypothetical protein
MAAEAGGPSEKQRGGYQKRLSANPLVSGIVDDLITAVSDEIAASFGDPSNTISLRDGRYIGHTEGLDLWSFEADQELPATPETPARLKVKGSEPIRCVVVAADDLDVVIGTADPVDEHPAHARLSLEPVFILEALRDRLGEAEPDDAGEFLIESLFDLNAAALEPTEAESAGDGLVGLSAEQRRVVERASRDGVQFVWGPPGTGKTGTLAAMVEYLVDCGERVMVLAHANAAVDVAMVRIADRMDGHEALVGGTVLRAGAPATPKARANQWINPDEVLRRTVPALIEEHDHLVERRAALARKARRAGDDRREVTHELEDVRSRLSAVQASIAASRNELINDAVVVGATLSRFAINDLINAWDADVIIIDEASMATNPFVVAAALRSPRTLALFGDFRQLPPVARATTQTAENWLARDIFDVSGVTSRVESGRADDRLSILQTQFRMGADIGSVVSRFAYFNMLRTHISADERAALLAEAVPAPGAQLAIVDVGEWSTACVTDAEAGSFSRFNLPTALLAASTACSALLGDSPIEGVGVIAAYRAQARFLSDLLRSEERIAAATTHRFQGGESDLIVLDLVDAHHQGGPSVLTGGDPALTRRLLNVAVSRARGKLVVVVDLDFVEHYHPPASPVVQLLGLMRERGAAELSVNDLVQFDLDGPVRWFESWTGGFGAGVEESARTIDMSLDDEALLGPGLIGALTAASGGGSTVRCRVPAAGAELIEDLDLDIQLRTLGAGPVAVITNREGEQHMLVGSRNTTAPAGLISDQHAIRTAWKLLTGEVMS